MELVVLISAFGRTKLVWLSTWHEMLLGIPSHDTFGRLFEQLDLAAMNQGIVRWIQAQQVSLPVQRPGSVRMVDGKQSLGSHDWANDAPALHLVIVWDSKLCLLLAQEAIATKSNEITAIPVLLQKLDLAGCLATSDMMGCQRTIAKQVIA